MTVAPRKQKKPAKAKATGTPAKKQPSLGGRPSDYKAEYAEQAAKLCALGATDYELAKFFKVTTSTIYLWRNQHPEFSESVVAGKAAADERVERSLYNRAVGYSYESEKVFQFQGKIVRAKTVEHVPPDPGAAFNWLKNRKGAEWREKSEVTVTHQLADLSDDELDKEIEQTLAEPKQETAH